MKLTTRDLDLTKLVISDEQSFVRSEGVHVSTVIRHIIATAGLQKENDFSEDDLDQFAMVGRLWERVLSETLYPRPRYERIGELEQDGIIGSPDAIDTEEWCNVEMKVTWVSSRAFQERLKFRQYLWQVKSYCHLIGTPRARIPVLHINGDWRPPKPHGKEYVLLFTPQELRENWEMIKRNAKT